MFLALLLHDCMTIFLGLHAGTQLLQACLVSFASKAVLSGMFPKSTGVNQRWKTEDPCILTALAERPRLLQTVLLRFFLTGWEAVFFSAAR
jgi:hypothetical protein